jgi:hypothetical protein
MASASDGACMASNGSNVANAIIRRLSRLLLGNPALLAIPSSVAAY